MTRTIFALAGLVALAGLASPALAGDPAAGKTVFNQCMACHKVGEGARNGVGPQLNGLFGRKAGSVEGFNYSDAYKAITDKVWDEANFRTYIKDPRGVTPGTRMAFAGIKGADADTKIDNLIAFLKQYGPDGKPPAQ